MTVTTLLMLVQGDPIDRVLLGYKKVGFGKGKFTGIGGKVEAGETIKAAALREMTEETGVLVDEKHLLDKGQIEFFFPAKPTWNLTIHIFLTRRWRGRPEEGREIRPKWFETDLLPFNQMWDDASYWYNRVLSGEKIRASFRFKSDNETIDTYQFHRD